MTDATTILALIRATDSRAEDRHKEITRRLSGIESRQDRQEERAEESTRDILRYRVVQAQKLEAIERAAIEHDGRMTVRLSAVETWTQRHGHEHHGDEETERKPIARTASAWTMANTYPGRVILLAVGMLSLTIYEVRVWLAKHAAMAYKVFWRMV